MGNNMMNTFGFISGVGTLVRGAKFVNGFASNLNGTMDLYTCPAGRKAYVNLVTAIGGTSVTGVYQIKIGGVYYNRTTTGVAMSSNSFATIPTVLNAGESVSVTIAAGGGSGANMWIRVLEMDISTPIYTARLLNLSAGNNILYTVSPGKTAFILDSFGGQGNAAGTPQCYLNFSGSARAMSSYIVPNGGSAGSTNQFITFASVGNNIGISIGNALSMNAGDSIVINTDSSASNQLAWLNYVEL